MFWQASTTQVITVGPMFDATDGITEEDALTVTSLAGEVHKFYLAGTAPGITTFTPTSTATYTDGGAMAAIASASGCYSLVLTPTLTDWRGWGKLVLRNSAMMIPWWENIFCGTQTTLDGFMGTDFLPVNAVQLNGVTATAATIDTNVANIQGTAVTATAAMMGVNVVNIDSVAPTATAAMIGVNIVNIDGTAPTATAAHFGVNVVQLATTGSALTAVPWNVAWATNINAEVSDVLNVDQHGEPGAGAPSVSIPLGEKIGYLFKFTRNKILTTATGIVIFNDDGSTAAQKAVISDDGTTFTRGEFGAP